MLRHFLPTVRNRTFVSIDCPRQIIFPEISELIMSAIFSSSRVYNTEFLFVQLKLNWEYFNIRSRSYYWTVFHGQSLDITSHMIVIEVSALFTRRIKQLKSVVLGKIEYIFMTWIKNMISQR